MNLYCVPVAQLDRVAPSEGDGQAFESPQGRHLVFMCKLRLDFLFCFEKLYNINHVSASSLSV